MRPEGNASSLCRLLRLSEWPGCDYRSPAYQNRSAIFFLSDVQNTEHMV